MILLLGDKIRELRKNKNMTQEELGVALGVAKNTVSYWERNENKPDYDMIIKIAKLFNVSTDYLFGLNGNDIGNIEKLKTTLNDVGIMVGSDLSIAELQQALKIVDLLKEKK